MRTFESDVRVVAAIEEPALLPLYDAWREPWAATLVMRRMRGGTVQDLLDAHALTPDQARPGAAHDNRTSRGRRAT